MSVPSTSQEVKPGAIVVEKSTRAKYKVLYTNDDGTMAVQPLKGLVTKWRVNCDDFELPKPPQKTSEWPLPTPATIPKGSSLRPSRLRSGLGD